PHRIDVDALWTRREVARRRTAERVVLVLREAEIMRRGDEAEVIGGARRRAYHRGPLQHLGALEVSKAFERRIKRNRRRVSESGRVNCERARRHFIAQKGKDPEGTGVGELDTSRDERLVREAGRDEGLPLHLNATLFQQPLGLKDRKS